MRACCTRPWPIRTGCFALPVEQGEQCAGDLEELLGIVQPTLFRQLGAAYRRAGEHAPAGQELFLQPGRPGGNVMGNWIPNAPTLVAQIPKTSSSYSPPPPEGFISPMTPGVSRAT